MTENKENKRGEKKRKSFSFFLSFFPSFSLSLSFFFSLSFFPDKIERGRNENFPLTSDVINFVFFARTKEKKGEKRGRNKRTTQFRFFLFSFSQRKDFFSFFPPQTKSKSNQTSQQRSEPEASISRVL